MNKRCFKCGSTKRISEFYKHPQMGDRHLGKCKTCTKRDTKDRVALKWRTDVDWINKERARCREKQKRYRENGIVAVRNTAASAKWDKANKVKKLAQLKANRAVKSGKLERKTHCEHCGIKRPLHKHHPDYSKPLSVVWLCTACHGIEHRKPAELKL